MLSIVANFATTGIVLGVTSDEVRDLGIVGVWLGTIAVLGVIVGRHADNGRAAIQPLPPVGALEEPTTSQQPEIPDLPVRENFRKELRLRPTTALEHDIKTDKAPSQTFFFVSPAGIPGLTSATWSFGLSSTWQWRHIEVHRSYSEFYIYAYVNPEDVGRIHFPPLKGWERITVYGEPVDAGYPLVRIPWSRVTKATQRDSLEGAIFEIDMIPREHDLSGQGSTPSVPDEAVRENFRREFDLRPLTELEHGLHSLKVPKQTFFFIPPASLSGVDQPMLGCPVEAMWSDGKTEIHRTREGEYVALVYISKQYGELVTRLLAQGHADKGWETLVCYAEPVDPDAALVRIHCAHIAYASTRESLKGVVYELHLKVAPETDSSGSGA